MEATRMKKKKLRSIFYRNLLINDTVEVRSSEDGLLGSWHPGKIITRERSQCLVKYDHLLSDDQKEYVCEYVDICSSVIGPGLESSSNYRGKLRPTPPKVDCSMPFLCSMCVDAYYKDAWWDGVIFDRQNDAGKRMIFFPDQGDELSISTDNLRLTYDWNEATGEWSLRGKWLLMQIIEELQPDYAAHVSIKQVWYDLRQSKLQQLMEWTSQEKSVWKELILEVLNEYMEMTADEFLSKIKLSQDLVVCNKSMCTLDYTTDSEPNSAKANAKDHGSDLQSRKNHFSSPSSIKPVEKLTCSKEWQPLNIKPVSTAAKSPSCVAEYLKQEKCDGALKMKVKQHLLFLGWEIDFRRVGAQLRVRYTSPDGKSYYSLTKVCKLVNGNATLALSSDSMYTSAIEDVPDKSSCDARSTNDNTSMSLSSNCLNTSAPEIAESVVSTYCPEAITEYIQAWDKVLKTDTKKRRELTERARQHLSAIGWRLWRVPKGQRLELRYESPEKKTYYSLITACRDVPISGPLQGFSKEAQSSGKSLLTNSDVQRTMVSHSEESIQKKLNDMEDGFPNRLMDIKKCSLLRKPSASIMHKKRKVTRALCKKAGSLDANKTSQVLSSSKRARQVMGPSSLSHNPRTVLSWLIDNNIVLPRAKVHYRGKDHSVMAEGRVTREGIKCGCCQNVFTLADFESHAKSTYHQPTSHIFLDDGRSLDNCQMQVLNNSMKNFQKDTARGKSGNVFESANDEICSVCHYGGEIVLCDGCPASFHPNCLNLQGVPDGDWYCPSCCCAICNSSQPVDNIVLLGDQTTHHCDQCERLFHVSCLHGRGGVNLDGRPKGKWFCSRTCAKIYRGLQKLQRKTVPLDHDDLTWTLFKPMIYESDDHDETNLSVKAENYSKLSLALEVMHECFEPVKEPRTGRDLVEDVIFGRRSELRRLNFTGFYTVLLEIKDELVSAATIRIYGGKVAEVPLVGTRFNYRRLGMCRSLMNELEKMLTELGVQRLVLPAVPSVLKAWTALGFSVMTPSDRSELLGYTFLDFPDTVMCHKHLRKPDLIRPSIPSSCHLDHKSPLSEVCHGAPECNDSADDSADQIVLEILKDGENNGCTDPSSDAMEITPNDQQCSTTENNPVATEIKDPPVFYRNEYKFKGEIKQYGRRKAVNITPVARTNYENVEVSCR